MLPHLIGVAATLVTVILLTGLAARRFQANPKITTPAYVSIVLLGLQTLIGPLAFLHRMKPLLYNLHLAVAILLLGATAWLTIRLRRES